MAMDSRPFLVLPDAVSDLSFLSDDKQEQWGKVEVRRKEVCGCGDIGKRILHGLVLLTNLGAVDDPDLRPGLAIDVADRPLPLRSQDGGVHLSARGDRGEAAGLNGGEQRNGGGQRGYQRLQGLEVVCLVLGFIYGDGRRRADGATEPIRGAPEGVGGRGRVERRRGDGRRRSPRVLLVGVEERRRQVGGEQLVPSAVGRVPGREAEPRVLLLLLLPARRQRRRRRIRFWFWTRQAGLHRRLLADHRIGAVVFFVVFGDDDGLRLRAAVVVLWRRRADSRTRGGGCLSVVLVVPGRLPLLGASRQGGGGRSSACDSEILVMGVEGKRRVRRRSHVSRPAGHEQGTWIDRGAWD
ncbi:hypothetical protein BRADI_1g02071v3 [Brachypodium distachyon]|uniref:Uncharacterized protein n=1 Tax=Brachypodium distachyon TaxID=15368 RepID=A0A0Q3GP29_BRADI|nr:hypothetical protein BRADI_1g02071v3 [Brachypodium distachyon]